MQRRSDGTVAHGIALLLVFASVACGSSGPEPGSAPGPDADASRAEVVAPDGDADADTDGSTCAGSAPGCPGPSCDQEVTALCVGGQWTCNGIPAAEVSFAGCECFDALTMGLAKCCPSLDGGASAAPYCAIPDGGQGKVGSGTLICAGGGTPYVADAGASSPSACGGHP